MTISQPRFPIFKEHFQSLRGDLSQAQFAEKLGLSRPTVSFYENGDRLPDALTLQSIALKCNVSVDWLLGLSKEKKLGARAVDQLGLTEKGAEVLQDVNQQFPLADDELRRLEYFNQILTHKDFPELLIQISLLAEAYMLPIGTDYSEIWPLLIGVIAKNRGSIAPEAISSLPIPLDRNGIIQLREKAVQDTFQTIFRDALHSKGERKKDSPTE